MISFIHKYQRYIYMVVTVIIVISFSFFGTYGAINQNFSGEQVAFTAVNGEEISRNELEEMVRFLNTNAYDKKAYGGQWGPNFLNDGVIEKDVLSNGLGYALIQAYRNDFQDLEQKLKREKNYAPYEHPQAKFISAVQAWNYFAPQKKAQFDVLKRSGSAFDPAALQARIGLYLSEKQFPGLHLLNVLKFQEKQYSWIQPDPSLGQSDLAMFGYRSIDDWFGTHFTRLVAEFIMNEAIVAQEKGYEISKAEVLADLQRNAQMSFNENKESPYLGAANSGDYLNEQLRLMGMDQSKAIKVWRQVMLFRRMYNDVGQAVFVDRFMYDKYNSFADQAVEGDLYRLPGDLRLNTYKGLLKLQAYINAVSKQDKNSTDLPTAYLSVAEVEKAAPELVQKRYLLEIKNANKLTLQTRVTLKDTWNWEADEKNWAKLKKEFPDLGTKKADTREERLAALDALDEMTRSRVDHFSRLAIVDEHPEWLEKALTDSQPDTDTLTLNLSGSKELLPGISKREELMKALDKNDAQLNAYTQDNVHYYRIKVLEKDADKSIMTFVEANQEGVLEDLVNKKLEPHYVSIRTAQADKFQTQDKEWKPLVDVQKEVGEDYYSALIKKIATDAGKSDLNGDQAANLRLFAYMQSMRDKTKAGQDVLKKAQEKQEEGKLAPRVALGDQWKLEKVFTRIERGSVDGGLNKQQILTLAPGAWSDLQTPPNGDLSFFLNKGKAENDSVAVATQIQKARNILSNSAERSFGQQRILDLKAKNALSLAYMHAGQDTMEPENN